MRTLHIGERFGRWTVAGAPEYIANSIKIYPCICECGCEGKPTYSSLVRRQSQSCGCLARESVTTHGLSGTREYEIFRHARLRCEDPSHPLYHNYGGRGIRFLFKSVEEFLGHIGPRPSANHSLDRIDNDGHYEPGNVRWATWAQQANNRRTNRTITLQGVTRSISEWAHISPIPHGTIRARVSRGSHCNHCCVFAPLNSRCRHEDDQ